MLGTLVELMSLLNRRNSVTVLSTTSSTFQTGIFNRRDIEREFQKWKIMRIMEVVTRALCGWSIKDVSAHTECWIDCDIFCLLFNQLTFVSSCLICVEGGQLVKSFESIH
jgi:hypothetical protein